MLGERLMNICALGCATSLLCASRTIPSMAASLSKMAVLVWLAIEVTWDAMGKSRPEFLLDSDVVLRLCKYSRPNLDPRTLRTRRMIQTSSMWPACHPPESPLLNTLYGSISVEAGVACLVGHCNKVWPRQRHKKASCPSGP